MIALEADTGFRPGSGDVAVDWYILPHIAAQVEFVDEGQQPHGIKNVNRPINMDGLIELACGDVSFFIKGGLTSSYLSHNGSGNGYRNNTGFTGGNIGSGVAYKLSKHWSAQAQVITMSYQQSDQRGYETFTQGLIGLKYTFD